MRHQLVCQADNRFRRTHDQEAIFRKRAAQPVQNVLFGLQIEVDQHVAAEDDVESSELAKFRQKIELFKPDSRAQMLVDSPRLALVAKIAQEMGDRQAALNLELRVTSLARRCDGRA